MTSEGSERTCRRACRERRPLMTMLRVSTLGARRWKNDEGSPGRQERDFKLVAGRGGHFGLDDLSDGCFHGLDLVPSQPLHVLAVASFVNGVRRVQDPASASAALLDPAWTLVSHQAVGVEVAPDVAVEDRESPVPRSIRSSLRRRRAQRWREGREGIRRSENVCDRREEAEERSAANEEQIVTVRGRVEKSA